MPFSLFKAGQLFKCIVRGHTVTGHSWNNSVLQKSKKVLLQTKFPSKDWADFQFVYDNAHLTPASSFYRGEEVKTFLARCESSALFTGPDWLFIYKILECLLERRIKSGY